MQTRLSLAALLALAPLTAAQQGIPPGLDVQAVVEERTHTAIVQVGSPFADVERALQAPNRNHDLRTYFLPGGVRVVQRSLERCGWRLDLCLSSWGRAGDRRAVEAVAPVADGAWVEYRRGTLTEWYLN